MKAPPFILATTLLTVLAVNVPAVVLYVDLNSTNSVSPYTDWSTAATNIQDAVDAANPSDLILVTNGVYQTGGRASESGYGEPLTNSLVVDKPLTVQSVNGPAVTVIEGIPDVGANAVRCVDLNDNATLSGFTLKNGGTAGSWPWGGGLDNISVQSGGGVYAEGPGAVVTNCIITGCSAYVYGGGVANGIVRNCTLTNNSAGNNGGGANNALLENCSLLDNQCSGSGGGANSCTLNNCVLTGNPASQNGGGAESCTLNNCTLTGNSAMNGGGADSSTLNNCIVYYNTAPGGNNYSSSTLNYCCTTPVPDSGTNNITANPQLSDTAHISANSPCIGAGSTNYSTGLDIDGGVWRNPPSIGCDEYYSSATGPLSLAMQADYTTVVPGFVVNLVELIYGHATDNFLDFGDGTVVSNQLVSAHSWTSPGVYNVTLTAFNDSNPGGVSATVTVQVVTQPIHYVSLAGTNPISPYLSWDTAATNIQDAIDAASVAGAVVLVSNGVYNVGGRVVYGSMTNRVAVNKPFAICSVNGPAFTAIEGLTTNDSSCIRCVYLTNDAALIGFTLTNGATIQGSDYVHEWSGAGVWCESSSSVVSNCVFVNNTAQGEGGGIYGGTLANCTFTNNYGYDGGAACASSLNHCTLINNRSYYGGGACGSTLLNCTLTGNFTYVDSDYTANGGGASGCALTNCVLAGNASNNGGGASGCTLINCVLTGNICNGVYFAGGGGASGSTLVNCTVIGNTCVNAGGGGVVSSVLTNCIVYFNIASSATNYSDDCSLYFCDTTPLPGMGANNIAGDPLFADFMHISSASPCRAAGSATATSGVDIDGDAWLNPPSIGCDEFNSASATGALAVAMSETYTNVATGFTVDFTAQISGHATANRWNFGDGTIISNQLFFSHSWAAAGNYTVTFTVFNTDNSGGVSASATIFVLQNPVHYVSLDGANPVAPFTSWATAATNIQDAIDAAFASGTVIVSNGVYQTGARYLLNGSTNRVAVTKPLALQSVNGAAVTVIDGSDAGSNAVRCLYLTNHVSVTGFTLRNGLAANGGGVFCQGDDVLNDCALIGNSSPYDWTSGGGAYGGILNRCTFTGNSASYLGAAAVYAGLNFCVVSNNGPVAYGGAGLQCGMINCLIVSNTAAWGGGVVNCEADNCLLLGNSALYGGGGAIWSTLNSCTVVGNTAGTGPGTYGGAGVYDGTANNCIIYYNNGDNCTADWEGISLNHSCSTPNPGGIGTIANAPLFVGLAGGDFHLQSNSPCINSGNNSFVTQTNDLDGNPRIRGGTVDIGSYEYQTPTSVISYAWLQQYGLTNNGSADYADADGDGFNNWNEWRAGTSPIDPSSLLKMTTVTNDVSGNTVTWQSVSGVTYFLQRSTNLAAPSAFSTIQTNIVGQPDTTSYTDTDAVGSGPFFYRVGVQQ